MIRYLLKFFLAWTVMTVTWVLLEYVLMEGARAGMISKWEFVVTDTLIPIVLGIFVFGWIDEPKW